VIGRKIRQLFVNELSVLGRRDHEDPLAGHELGHSVHGVLEKAPIPEKLEELLGPVAA
jgi:hypothetical protein